MVNVTIIETSGLGDRSYLINDGEVAVAVDPQRDIDRVLELTGGLRITHVLETHIHSDYVTGGLALAKATGAQYVVPAGEDVNFDRRTVEDGDRVDTGEIHLEALLIPGHTHHHVSYLLRGVSGDTVGVFTGGSLRSWMPRPFCLNWAVTEALAAQRLGRSGCPYTATTTVRSMLLSDHTPMLVFAQSRMIAMSSGL